MVYLDKFTRKYQPKSIVKGEQRDRLVRSIMDILSDWRLSAFENEGDCRAGLRRGLCLAGHPWGASDLEATSLVEEGLKRNRAVRPSWQEGQWDFTVPEDCCRACHQPLGEPTKGKSAHFCSVRCAKTTLLYRQFEHGWYRDETGKRAYEVIQRARTTPRTCKQCEKTFRVLHNTDKHQFCSHSCYSASMRIFSNLTCEDCGNSFRPDKEGRKFCSRKCYEAARKEQRHLRQCECCGSSFVTKVSSSRYCSKACISKMYYRRKKAAVILQFPTLSPAVFDQEFAIAAGISGIYRIYRPCRSRTAFRKTREATTVKQANSAPAA